jgi:hypothetical protein
MTKFPPGIANISGQSTHSWNSRSSGVELCPAADKPKRAAITAVARSVLNPMCIDCMMEIRNKL